jgi:hypothetical protein
MLTAAWSASHSRAQRPCLPPRPRPADGQGSASSHAADGAPLSGFFVGKLTDEKSLAAIERLQSIIDQSSRSPEQRSTLTPNRFTPVRFESLWIEPLDHSIQISNCKFTKDFLVHTRCGLMAPLVCHDRRTMRRICASPRDWSNCSCSVDHCSTPMCRSCCC